MKTTTKDERKKNLFLDVEELEERIAPSGVKGGYGGNPHDAPPGQGNWGAGPGNSGSGDQHGNNDQGGGGQPGGNPGLGDNK